MELKNLARDEPWPGIDIIVCLQLLRLGGFYFSKPATNAILLDIYGDGVCWLHHLFRIAATHHGCAEAQHDHTETQKADLRQLHRVYLTV